MVIRFFEELQALKRDDANVRRGAALALGKIGGERAKAGLLALQQTPETVVRDAVFEGLTRFVSEDVTQAFVGALSDSDYGIRRRAAEYLAERNYLPDSPEAQAAYHIALGNSFTVYVNIDLRTCLLI